VMDGFIAATAQVHDLTLVTRNAKDFTSTGVDVHNPWTGWTRRDPHAAQRRAVEFRRRCRDRLWW